MRTQEIARPSLSVKERLLAEIERRRRRKQQGTQPIEALDRTEYPLTHAQQRLWFLDKMEGASAAYNVAVALRFAGALELDALRAALRALVTRHAALRTRFETREGTAVQTVQPALEPALRIVDLRATPEGSRQGALSLEKCREVSRPFGVEDAVLLRATAVLLDAGQAVLLLTMHHIISDGWSLNVAVRDLLTLYAEARHGKSFDLPPLPVQFGDYAQWQQDTAGQMEAGLDFWREELTGAPPLLGLPLDRPRPARSSHAGDVHLHHVDAALLRELEACAQQRRVSVFALLMTAFAATLARHAGQPDLVVGMPAANRDRPEVRDLVGFFANTVPLRVRVAGDAAIGDVAQDVHARILRAMEHQAVPFERIVDGLGVERSLAHAPVFQVMFGLNNTAQAPTAIELPGLSVTLEPMPVGGAKFDLSISYTQHATGLEGHWEYSTELFDADTVAALAARFQLVLAALAAGSALPTSRIPLVDAAAKRELSGWGTGERRALRATHPVTVFESIARSMPQAIAIASGERTLSFGDLDDLANRLAHRLRALGVRPGDRVVLPLERDVLLPALVLGALKCGAAYVPLDPRMPLPRLEKIIADCRPRLVVAPATLAAQVPGAISVGELCESADGLPQHAPDAAFTPDSILYVIYTSGTSGVPKGVAVPAQGVMNLVDWHAHTFGVTQYSRATLLAGVGFDAMAWELWANLLRGARLCLPPEELLLEPAALARYLAAERITHCFMPTPLGESVLPLLDAVPSLRVLLVGGDRLTSAPPTRTHFRLVNNYGPTETSVVATSGEVLCGAAGAPDIGAPIDNLQAYVLDASLELQPSGVIGELFIGGVGLAQGYLHQPALTAERFVPDPFSGVPGARLYRTGDLVRWRAGGRLEFLGRADSQMKIRGHRIEAGEIENQLLQHSAIAQAAVLLREDPAGTPALVAYVSGTGADTALLRDFLQERLPDYMVPALFVHVAQMPVTANGKLDRAALPAPDWTARAARVHAEPVGDTESGLAALWSELLNQPAIGRHDTFFELGGHSMLAARMIEAVRGRFGVAPPLKELWSHSSIAQFAARIDALLGRDQAPAAGDGLPRIDHDASRRYEPFALTDVQQAYWMGRSNAFEIGNVAAHAYTEHDLRTPEFWHEGFEAIMNRLIARHDMLRMIVLEDGTQQVLTDPGRFRIPYRDLTGLSPQEREAALLETREQMSHHVFAPDQWPLFEMRMARIEPDLYRLYWSFDGLVLDGFSQQVLIREMFTLLADDRTELPPLSITFRDYVVGLEALRRGALFHRDQAYWMARLEDFPAAPELPLAVEPSQVSQPRFVRREFHLPAASWERIRQKARRAGVTPSSVLLSAYGEVLARWSKNQRLALNLTMFNRLPLHADVDRLLGDFTSLTLLEVDCRAPKSFAERCRQVQQQLWEDMEHRHFTGLDVMRELRRRTGTGRPVRMPVVFSSMLDMEQGPGGGDRPQSDARSSDNRNVFAVSQTSQVWLDHQASEADGALHVAWDAVEALFPEGVLEGMFGEYVGLLERLAGDGAAWDSAAGAGLPARQRQLRDRVNATEWSGGSGELLHEGFWRQAQAQPQALAVWSDGVKLTYGELRQIAGFYAHELRSAGIGRNELVAVVMKKGWEQVAAVLAVLESGAAYLPIDAGLPASRIEQLLKIANVRAVLRQPGVQASEQWPELLGSWIVNDRALAAPVRAPIPPVQSSTDLAYVIFTSGSTGEPKGVMIDHRGARNTCDDINAMFQVGASDRVLAVSSLSFDLSVYDIFGLLAAGGAIVLPRAGMEKDPAHWAHLVREAGVTVWNSVPALMQLFVEHHEQHGEMLPGCLREVMLSGDWIPVALPERIRALNASIHVTSLGGATEASIWSIYYPIGEVEPDWKSIPYGRPLANQTYHVLKEDLTDCPDWVVGHLYIGGIGVALGYWGDEKKTAASFITQPRTGRRLYRTGDLGRYLPSGDIEFLGREDGQVKVQGHRIELGEIESALLRQPGVQESVVVALGERADHKRLVGYVVMQAAPALKSEGSGIIRDELERVLFKLSRPGSRILKDVPTLPLAVKRELAQSWERGKSLGTADSTPEQLGQWLGAVAGWPVEGSPLPKYHYPSSGSLNPIQTYLEIGAQAVSGVAPGTYYFDPVGHRLQRVGGTALGAKSMQAHLIATLGAVEPLYGDASLMLCELEAGYVAESLRLAAAPAGLALADIDQAADRTASLLAAVALAGKAQVMQSFEVTCAAACAADHTLASLERQSYRQFASRALGESQLRELLAKIEPHPELQWVVQVRDQAVAGWSAGYYRLEGSEWRALSLSTDWPADRYGGDSARTHAQAAVAIYAVGQASHAARLQAGMQGQRLCVAGVKRGIGLCPIGGFNSAALEAELGLAETHGIVHSWLAGAIDPVQATVWQQQGAPATSMTLPERLRAALAETLPAYMVPAAIVVLDKLPLTGNGKVDRRALPEPAEAAAAAAYVAPRTALEIQLVQVWQEVLGLERVGVRDHFFETGGDSLKAVQVQTRLRAGMRIDLELREIYTHPTIEALANLVAGRTPAAVDASAGSIKSAAARYRKRQLVAQMSDADVTALLEQHRTRHERVEATEEVPA